MANLELGQDKDYLTWDNTKTIRLRLIRRDGDRDFLVTYARRSQVSRREAEPTGGVYTIRETVYNLPVDTCFERPEVGFLIIDGNTTWTIRQVDDARNDTRYRCHVLDMALTANMTELVDFWQPTFRKDAANSVIGEFLPKHQGVQAAIQEISGDAVSEAGRDGSASTFRVIVAQRLYVDKQHQIRVRTGDWKGEIFEILSHEGADQIDRLQTFTCRKGLW